MQSNPNPQLHELIESLKAEFNVYELEVSESPVFIAVAMPNRPEVTGLRPRLPAGRGLSAAQAILTAAAEGIELLASLAQNCDCARGQIIEQNNRAFVVGKNLSNGTDQLLCAQNIYLDWATVFNEPLDFDADSNGCASGNTLDQAINRAVLECIERDAVATWWLARQSRRHIPMTCLDRISPRLSWWLSTRSRGIKLIDVTSDIGVPVVAAISYDDVGSKIAIGSAAAVNLEEAAISAVTEMIQMEVSMTIGSPNDELENWHAKASIHDMKQFRPNTILSPFVVSHSSPLEKLIAAGHQTFAFEMTREFDLLKTVRVVSPTLSPLRRQPNLERIIAGSFSQPQFEGITSITEIETLELY